MPASLAPGTGARHDPAMTSLPTSTASPAAKLAAYRALATAAQLTVSALCALYAPPWLAVAVTGLVGALFGKLLGVPLTDVTQQALTKMQPEHAVAVTVSALQSQPPAALEAATAQLMASLPPDARARASLVPPAPTAADRPTVIQFVGATEPPPSASTTPVAPDGTPIPPVSGK